MLKERQARQAGNEAKQAKQSRQAPAHSLSRHAALVDHPFALPVHFRHPLVIAESHGAANSQEGKEEAAG